MSDQSEYPSESMPGQDNGLRPLSNAEDLSLGNNSDLARIMNRAGIALPNGFPLDDDDDDDEELEQEYVSVDQDEHDYPYWFRRPHTHNRTKLDELHPFVQLLSASNVDDCVKVENAFPEPERCSYDKFVYRLTRCPELSLGLFTLPLLAEGETKPRPILVGHIIATRTSEPSVTDRSMRLPANWESERWSFEDGQAVGHEEGGSTIAIHSLAVEPEHQGKQVGSTLMKSYIHRIREAQIADRIAIIAHEHLVPFYESFGFESRGPSKCQFGGGGWVDLILEFGPEPVED
ncbi:hypothetical protein N7541_003685 [Penicillium brevicompactum]|uniref:N-acetyltransferase domain-containing protein n=1 Tax=Penicillium brevicompactum TaxID=5074 RepID=A0A9W9URJ9_PENBR|nr:uncharacterized protein N7506_007638 [Penicillium brevicompactum]KAJ5333855.1 hypothetical protein N7506_007638 [Penicillium brevicompactum]KAJ5352870.1 hypothetical protein N7452_001844 [Penicillium brevicompactum]KAJ5362841.1 hypothetical protein N7541_003685 [Penicillium brevicompactum]